MNYSNSVPLLPSPKFVDHKDKNSSPTQARVKSEKLRQMSPRRELLAFYSRGSAKGMRLAHPLRSRWQMGPPL